MTSTINHGTIRAKQLAAANAMLAVVAVQDDKSIKAAARALTELSGLTSSMVGRMVALERDFEEQELILRDVIFKRDEAADQVRSQADVLRDIMKDTSNADQVFHALTEVVKQLDRIEESIGDVECEAEVEADVELASHRKDAA